MKFGPEPVPVVRAEGVPLSETRGIRISRNDFEDEVMNGGKKFRGGLLFIVSRFL